MNLKQFYILLLSILMLISACDKKVSRSPVEVAPQEGKIIVSSTPSGFTIYLNGKNTGRKTPDSLIFLDGGNYELTLKKDYFKDTTVTLQLPENEKLNITIDYLSNASMYGDLALYSFPNNAQVIINDSLTSILTPDTIRSILPGEYRIKYQKYSYRGVEFVAIVKSSQILSYSEELRDTSVWVDYQLFNSGIPSNSLSAINIDQNNVKWIGSLDAGLIRFDDNNFTSYNTSNSQIPSNRIACISVDPVNNIWVGTDNGFAIFNGNFWTIYNRDNSELTSNLINAIKFDESGIAWIGTSANLVKFDGSNFTIYNDSLERDWINDVTIISNSELWLATSTSGILKFQNGDFVAYPKVIYNYPTYSLTSTEKDNMHNIWFCFLKDSSGRSGITFWDGNSFNNFFPGTSDININDVFIDNNNSKWFSTNEGLIHFNNLNISESFRSINSLITSDNVQSTVVDQSGNVWITTFGGGLNKYKPPQ
jgi:streptogramin lyase